MDIAAPDIVAKTDETAKWSHDLHCHLLKTRATPGEETDTRCGGDLGIDAVGSHTEWRRTALAGDRVPGHQRGGGVTATLVLALRPAIDLNPGRATLGIEARRSREERHGRPIIDDLRQGRHRAAGDLPCRHATRAQGEAQANPPRECTGTHHAVAPARMRNGAPGGSGAPAARFDPLTARRYAPLTCALLGG